MVYIEPWLPNDLFRKGGFEDQVLCQMRGMKAPWLDFLSG